MIEMERLNVLAVDCGTRWSKRSWDGSAAYSSLELNGEEFPWRLSTAQVQEETSEPPGGMKGTGGVSYGVSKQITTSSNRWSESTVLDGQNHMPAPCTLELQRSSWRESDVTQGLVLEFLLLHHVY